MRRPRAPLIAIKREVTSSIESAEFVLDEDFDVIDEKPVKIEPDPRQLRAGIAALAIRPPLSAASSSSSKAAAAPGPSGWGVRGVSLGQIPCGELGPADPPLKRGRPKGSKAGLASLTTSTRCRKGRPRSKPK